jgi:flavin reductase (DIM6/NTAB) family NADH-FMN oxidoreductase RutF
MANSAISIDELKLKSLAIWDEQWFLLTAGNFAEKKFNSMTISWGSIGVMWGRTFFQVVVRPTRYTLGFMQKYPDFTVCAFPKQYHKALEIMGSKSGRDIDKVAKTGLTPCAVSTVGAPAYAEANLVFECRKIYSDVFHPEAFLEPKIEENYPRKDYHIIFYGEILAVSGDKTLYC